MDEQSEGEREGGERARRGERKKSITHGSRKIRATLARLLHSMCWNAGGGGGSRDRERGQLPVELLVMAAVGRL